MQLYKSAAFFFLVATAAAGPLPQDPLSSHIITRDTAISQEIYDIKRDDIVSFDLEDRSELSTRQAPSVRDVTCPDNKKTYTAEAIKTAMSSENAKASPGEYKNKEGGKQLFAVPTSTQLYKASLDSKWINSLYMFKRIELADVIQTWQGLCSAGTPTMATCTAE